MSVLDVWNNQARIETIRSPLGIFWLFPMVTLLLSSSFFAADYDSARLVLGGFIVSHFIIMAVIPMGPARYYGFVLRKGHVSLSHVTCWTAGWVCSVSDVWAGRIDNNPTAWAWYMAYIVVVGISLLLDLNSSVQIVQWTMASSSSSKQKQTKAV